MPADEGVEEHPAAISDSPTTRPRDILTTRLARFIRQIPIMIPLPDCCSALTFPVQ
jgi:hypothetical protein